MGKNSGMRVEFAPGCFDQFEGSQEELDALVQEIKNMVADGSIFKDSEEIDWDALTPDERKQLSEAAEWSEQSTDAFMEHADEARKRRLN